MSEAEPESAKPVPLALVEAAVLRSGYTAFDLKSFLFGFCLGRAPSLEEHQIEITAMLLEPRMAAPPPPVYHVTTVAKLAQYQSSRCILPPVRFWPDEATARRWMRRTGRELLITFPRPATAYPLPDHKPSLWSPDTVRGWDIVEDSPRPTGVSSRP